MPREHVHASQEQEPIEQPVVGIIMGSDSDLPIMYDAVTTLELLHIPYSVNVISAHRSPDVLDTYATTAKERGLKIIIAGAGSAAHLPGVTASKTLIPIIGVPIAGKRLDGMDALLSEVQMPPGVPVAVMAINGAKNAAIFAAQMLAMEDPEMHRKLEAYRSTMREELAAKDQQLHEIGIEVYIQKLREKNEG